jgi:hypothetical protein
MALIISRSLHVVGPPAGSSAAHALASPHNLIDQQELLGEGRGNMQPVLLGDVVVVDLLFYGGDCAQGDHVEPHCQLVLVVLVFQEDDGLLDVVAAVLGEDLQLAIKVLLG